MENSDQGVVDSELDLHHRDRSNNVGMITGEIIGEYVLERSKKVTDEMNIEHDIAAGTYPLVGIVDTAARHIRELGIVFDSIERVSGQSKSLVQFVYAPELRRMLSEASVKLEPRVNQMLADTQKLNNLNSSDDNRRMRLGR